MRKSYIEVFDWIWPDINEFLDILVDFESIKSCSIVVCVVINFGSDQISALVDWMINPIFLKVLCGNIDVIVS